MMQRTHRLREDRAWLPRSVRSARLAVSGTIWAATGAAIVGAAALGGPAAFAMWKGFVIGGAAAAAAGDRAGNAMLHRQLKRMTRGELQLAELSARAEGELVVVRGKIACESPLTGVLVDVEGVYRRMIFEPAGKWVHEAATDFTLIDDKGAHIIIQTAGARWMVRPRELVTYPGARFSSDRAPREVSQLAATHPTIEAYEQVLAVGTEVQVVGYKTASADVSGEVVDYRLPPQRATLRSGDDLPLVITATSDLA
jgi:hypothetical protein